MLYCHAALRLTRSFLTHRLLSLFSSEWFFIFSDLAFVVVHLFPLDTESSKMFVYCLFKQQWCERHWYYTPGGASELCHEPVPFLPGSLDAGGGAGYIAASRHRQATECLLMMQETGADRCILLPLVRSLCAACAVTRPTWQPQVTLAAPSAPPPSLHIVLPAWECLRRASDEDAFELVLIGHGTPEVLDSAWMFVRHGCPDTFSVSAPFRFN